jgi:hypothetical protein
VTSDKKHAHVTAFCLSFFVISVADFVQRTYIVPVMKRIKFVVLFNI